MNIIPYDFAYPEKIKYSGKKFLTVGVLGLGILQGIGTGAHITGDSFLEYSARWGYNQKFSMDTTVIKHKNYYPNSTKYLLESIRDIFMLNMSEMAFIFNVSRPTVYAWLEGQDPIKENFVHIYQISEFALKVKNYNIPDIRKFIRRPIFSGSSLLEKLREGEDIQKYINLIQEISKKEHLNRQKIKGSEKQIRNTSEVLSQYSSPFFDSRV